MRLLDLFCGAGGAAMGYSRAGFDEIVGVDIKPQPRYPFHFVQGDALDFCRSFGAGFDAIHASPPCQHYSVNTKQHGTMAQHVDAVASTREVLASTMRPYIIENVVGAPLLNPVLLCGSMFGEPQLRRHRLFESNVCLMTMPCQHKSQRRCISVTGHAGGSSRRDGERFGSTETWKTIMGIDWMTGYELAQSIPPRYTLFLGRQLYAHITAGLDSVSMLRGIPLHDSSDARLRVFVSTD